jgi:hypothetical protein
MSKIKLEFYCDVEEQTVKPSKNTLRFINSIDAYEDIGSWVEGADAFRDLSAFISDLYHSITPVDPNNKEAVEKYMTKEQVLEKWAVE